MAKNYRIQLIEVFNVLNELTETKFAIQKKFLWWWVNLKLPRILGFYNHNMTFVKMHGNTYSKTKYFPTLPIAKAMVDKLIFMPKKYKHKKIFAGVNDNNFVYCIKLDDDHPTGYDKENKYVIFFKINDLKEYVDRVIHNKQKNKIKEVKKQNVYYFHKK